ncbi:zinc finger protein ZFP2-like isoform X2 [Aethina tumida]|uniref:zinc finger protein ZFP2-like isoform X2 n=1 Tax=Aethina tumida TaxID=116153 RepID=UPI0021493797|nr:zinc finger protein ZFP2-like isoform X2 [Aethina tumida]
MSAVTTQCMICRGNCISSRNSIHIFSKDVATHSGRPLATIVSQLVEREIKEDPSQTQLLCKKCFKLCNEVDELQSRVTEIKTEVLNNFKSDKEDEEFDEDKTKIEPISEAEVPKKILDIPSSDEDTTNVKKHYLADDHAYEYQVNTEKSFHTIEDIEMELVKIHGEAEEESKEGVQVASESYSRTFSSSATSDMMESNTGEHSSESDFEQGENGEDILVQAAAVAERNIMEYVSVDGVRVKLEPVIEEVSAPSSSSSHQSSEKPNILKKKTSSTMNGLEEKQREDTLGPNVSLVERDGSIYTCLLCQGDEVIAGEAKAIAAHIKAAHGQRVYICDVCGADFRKRNELSAHLDEHVAAEDGDFQCEVCNRIFNNLRLFRIHRRMHYPHNKAWTCETCGKKYSSKNLLDEHVNTHLGLRPYVCNLCGKNFASKYTFKAHEKTHEVRPRPFSCGQCPKTFLSHQNLAQHERTHSGLKEFACHLCGKQFGSMHNLEVHSIVHTGVKPFVCGECGKKFARKAEIRDHERTHTGERPFQCEMCGATFSQRSNLQSHKRATHYDDKRYICKECGKGFKRRRLLDYHVKAAHTGERPFKCDVCEATFVYPEHFKKHRRIHTGEKPFLCEVCGKAFNSRDNRNAHRFVHSDKKPYECLVCGAGFMRKPLLYQHMQSQGHLNDTIVVNQPRLTTDDDQLVTVNSAGEMEIVDASGSSIPAESKLYIADGTEHILIDGQQINFTTAASDEEENNDDGEIVDEIEQVVIGEGDYEEIINGHALASGETQIIETPDGPVQLVKVRIPNENGEEEETWIKIVPE